MEWIEEEGKTKEEAIDRALARLGRTLREVEVEVVEEQKRLLKFLGGKGTRVRVYYHPETPALAEAKLVLERLLELLHVRADVIGRVDEGVIQLEVHSDSSGLIIGKKGRTLESLQYILTRLVENKRHERMRITIDIENYRERRAEQLAIMARRIAREVRSTGQSQPAPPLSPADRRLFHMALHDDPDVTTASEGEGFMRTVVVFPAYSPTPHDDLPPDDAE